MKSTNVSITSFTSITSATLLGENVQRKGFSVYNEGPGTLYLRYGSTAASTTAYTVQIEASAYFEDPHGWVGPVRAIFGSAGTARVTEIS